ncbi:hypothetical protein [Leptospira ainazelensis]|uniref:hypothetical protein n=1 Tax=Leptospira ainazelensis TaxID=2810034 RepID=UPI001963AD0F|nr:hypothetical protein [Leptospira ainazelensis]
MSKHYRRIPFLFFISFLLSFQNLFSQNIVPVSPNSSENQEEDLKIGDSQTNSKTKETKLSQKEIRMKKKFFVGGIYFPSYGSGILGWNVSEKVSIGIQYYQNSKNVNGDFDTRYSHFLGYGMVRQSDRESKTAGGGIFLNYFLWDSSVYIPFLVGGEFMRNTRHDQFIDSTGVQSYRNERVNFDYGPRYYAGTGIGIRHQFESGFFFGFEIVVRTFGRYHKNVSLNTLEYGNRPATIEDFWIRKEELKRDHAGKVYDAGFDFAVGIAF